MRKCPACSREVTDDGPSCPSCGEPLPDSFSPTKLMHEAQPTSPIGEPVPARTLKGERRAPPASAARPGERFAPGTILMGRYRIISPLGRGGMGEVYSADDLRLGQQVALKFLPAALADDGAALARFHREVRIARQVSHRHVCRVYDIGEADGHPFLSMEYIRGEELSSFLRRSGRLTSERAVEVARQLCAGLAAAHDAGVLHRDLKPSNVMIDQRGDVRITDFGIAGLAEELREQFDRAGTPAYMSPEQLAGREVTARSDIYALGLLLYEIFTGKPAFDAATAEEVIRQRRTDTTPTSPSHLVRDIDPLSERVILRCLETDPALRPASALQVAAALPGGDPVAAALAAGETPSPEMVAASPKEGALRPGVAAALLGFVAAGLLLLCVLSESLTLHRRVPLSKSPDVLRERAAEIARRAGYDAPPRDTAGAFGLDNAYLTHVRDTEQAPTRWDKLAAGQPAAIHFWFRQGPRHFEPVGGPEVGPDNPPNDVPGMALLKLDTTGRLFYFEAVPQQSDDGARAGEPPDWAGLFREAGLDPAAFRPTVSLWTPPHAYDTRAAWEGAYPLAPDMPLRVEAAGYRGRPVYFELVGPWRRPSNPLTFGESRAELAAFALRLVIFSGALVAGSWLAWRSLRLGRGDRRGAFRLAFFLFVTRMLHWAAGAHHAPTFGELTNSLIGGLQSALFWACFIGVMYLGLEPFLRRRWPERVISWSRLLAGRFADPLVGRDVLVGAALGVALMLTYYVGEFVPRWLGMPPNVPDFNYGIPGLGLRGFVPLLTDQVVAALAYTFIVVFVILFLSMLLRSNRLGFAAGWAVLSVLEVLFLSYRSPVSWPFSVVNATLIIVAARFGPLTLLAALFFRNLYVYFPVTTELGAWYAAGFLLDLLVLAAVALYAFRSSLAGQPLFGGRLLED